MPYKSKSDLPENVQNVLPSHAQEIYLEAYNSAWDQYDEPEERRGDSSREETAHRSPGPLSKTSMKRMKRPASGKKNNGTQSEPFEEILMSGMGRLNVLR